jgi:uncharacterized protein YcnI
MRRIGKLGALLALVVTALAVLAPAAFAHVTVSAPGATPGGGDQLITFRVPNESAKGASTIKLQVSLPTDTPIASVDVAPHPGWTSAVKTVTLAKPIVTDDGDITQAVSEITWTADSTSDGIKPGQFDQFVIIAGQLPDSETLTFPAIQTYSDGTVVKWIQVPAPGSTAEPDDPAPMLSLAAASPTAAAASHSSSNTGPIVLAVIALVIACAALGFAVVTRAKVGQRT